MSHAVLRDPIDVCRRLGQEWIVLGNSGVVRILSSRTGYLPEGTLCAFAPIAKQDPYGYVRTVCAYDEPGTMGTLAERFYVNASQLVPLPDEKVVPLARWASFPVRYTSAWSNWRVALGAWRLQMPSVSTEQTHVWAWGGGVAFAELDLARSIGCKTVMFHTGKERGEIIRAAGITPVDRERFPGLTTAIPPNRKGTGGLRQVGTLFSQFGRQTHQRAKGVDFRRQYRRTGRTPNSAGAGPTRRHREQWMEARPRTRI